MKQKLPLILIALAFVIVSCAIVIVACSSIDGRDELNSSVSSDTDASSDTDLNESDSLSLESGVFTEHTYLAQSEKETEDNSSQPEQTNDNSSSESSEKTEYEKNEPDKNLPSLTFVSFGDGTCSVADIGTFNEAYLEIPSRSPQGDIVISINAKAFYQNSFIKAIEIPSTVMHIGEMAFSNCPSLVYITVDKSNRMYKDVSGVLYNAGLTNILCYPSGSGMSSIRVPSTLKSISPMAFFGCDSLKTINFEGSVDKWSQIIIGEMNYGLYSASVSCSSK